MTVHIHTCTCTRMLSHVHVHEPWKYNIVYTSTCTHMHIIWSTRGTWKSRSLITPQQRHLSLTNFNLLAVHSSSPGSAWLHRCCPQTPQRVWYSTCRLVRSSCCTARHCQTLAACHHRTGELEERHKTVVHCTCTGIQKYRHSRY